MCFVNHYFLSSSFSSLFLFFFVDPYYLVSLYVFITFIIIFVTFSPLFGEILALSYWVCCFSSLYDDVETPNLCWISFLVTITATIVCCEEMITAKKIALWTLFPCELSRIMATATRYLRYLKSFDSPPWKWTSWIVKSTRNFICI